MSKESRKTVSIIGCGSTGQNWFNTPCDLSIGVNDCLKWGKDPDWLIVVNRHFTPEREQTIKRTNPGKLFTNSAAYWPKFFPQAEVMRLQQYGKHLKKGHIYSSKTSPFVALSLAFNAHADTIILHGVDLNDHPEIKNKVRDYELRQFERFIRQLNEYGTKVFVSSKESSLSKFLHLWTFAGEANGSDCKSDVHQFESDNVLKKCTINPVENLPDRRPDIYVMGEVEVIRNDETCIVLKGLNFECLIESSEPNFEKLKHLSIGHKFKAYASHE